MKSKSPSSKSGNSKIFKGRSLKRSSDLNKSKKLLGSSNTGRNRRFKGTNTPTTSPGTIRTKLGFKQESSSSNYNKRSMKLKNSSRSPGLLASSKSKPNIF
jgi:hypothetical protein